MFSGAFFVVVIFLFVFAIGPRATAQQASQLSLGENTKVNAGGLFTFGYDDAYGDGTLSNHGLDLGFDGRVTGYYYNPRFISFNAHPYYDQSRADSDSQSITGASGLDGTVNFFTGSHFPGAVSYNYAKNSTGTVGLAGQPNFTTHGTADGIGINWSALVPDWPSLLVGYSQGGGHGTIYGTSEEDDSSTKLFHLSSNYRIAGFGLSANFDHNSINSQLPQFLSGEGESVQSSSGHDIGFGVVHALPVHGQFTLNYTRASEASNYLVSGSQSENDSNSTSYTDSTETANASFHPTQKLTFNASQNYTNNLTGYFTQNLGTGGVPVPGVNLGSGSYSSTMGGGASYLFTDYLSGTAQATYYDQHYFGESFSGEYLSGTLGYTKRLWDMFSFSATVIDSSSGMGQNAVGFVGNVNYFRRIGHWETSGQFSYSQNVQTFLITYTTSGYSYNATLHRRLAQGISWSGAFSGSHSGLTNDAGTSTHSESYSSSFSMRRVSLNAMFAQSSGISLLGAGGIIVPGTTPGLTDYILFSGASYGGGISVTPIKRMSISGSYNRSISNTLAATDSHNNTEILNGQMQYHLRRIGLDAGYTRFTQGISAIGAPVNSTSFFVGMTRWFDFF
jgi:hypothetical protein